MKQKLLLILLATFVAAHPLTIERTTHTAKIERPLLKAQQQTIIRSRHAESQARGAYLPQLSAHHSSVFDQKHSTSNSSTHTLSLKGSQLIFSPNGPQLQTKIAAQGTARTQHVFTATTHKVQHDATLAFLTAWLLAQKQPLIDALQALHQTTTTRATNEYALAQTSVHDFATISATTAAQKAIIDSYPHECATANAALQTAMGTTDKEQPALNYTSEPIPHLQELSFYIDTAYQYRPELKANKASQKQHELSARSQRLSYLPSLHLNGIIGRTFSGTGPDRGTNASVGLSANWQFFDGMQRSHAAQAADADALRTQFEHQELRNSIRQQITTAYHTLKASLVKLQSAQTAYETQTGLWHRDNQALRLGSIDANTHRAREYEYHKAAHNLQTHQVQVRKEYETLAWQSGYAPTIARATLSENV